jgi:hypothetical protein
MASDRARDQLRGAFIAIVAAVIAAAGTLVGGALANANAREQLSAQFSHEDTVRQYESRRDTYEKFIAATSQARADLLILAGQVENNQSTSLRQQEKVLGHYAQLATLASGVQIVGSRKVAELALLILKTYEQLFRSNLGPKEAAKEIGSTADDVEAARVRFAKAAGDELNKQ